MSSQISEDQEKIDAYFDVIEQRILTPIQNTDVRESCTATLLLLFAAIDGLGRLLHPKSKVKPRTDRIRIFLDYMGDDYKLHKEELIELRNTLVHNAINVEAFLSKSELGRQHHLKKMIVANFFYVHTITMYNDFVEAFKRFRNDLKNPEMMKRAADRLKCREDYDPVEWGENYPDHIDKSGPTHPPLIEFIQVDN